MYRMKMYLLVLVGLLSCSLYLSAQDTASLTGTVTDSSGAVIAGASVELANPSTGKTYKAVTNSLGSYSIADIPAGPGYSETVKANGHLPLATFDRNLAKLAGTILPRI